MTSEFTVFCIKKTSSPPQALSRRKESGEFYCHIDVPIPDQLVIFSEGQWEERKGFDVNLRYKDDEILLGHINRSASCLSWRRDSSIPASMACESEKGLAKLVLEHSSGPPILEKMEQTTDKSLQPKTNNTNQVTEETSKGTKNKRRSSLGKDDKTPNGPNTKKQKTQNTKATTRVRSGKSDSQAKIDSQENKPVSVKKDNSLNDVKSETPTEKRGRKGSKTNMKDDIKEESNDKVVKDTKVIEKNEDKKSEKNQDKKVKKEKTEISTDKSDSGPVKDKKTRKDSKTDVKASPDSDKKRRKGSRTEIKTKTDINTENDENKTDSATDSPAENTGSQLKKRGRKKKDQSQMKETFAEDKCDKENINVNLPTPSPEVQKQILALTKSNVTTDTSQEFGKQKMASCKDLTSRVLARPTGRWGHSLCFVHKNLSVLIGGQGEKQQLNKDSVWNLDTETRRWKSTATQSEGQKPEYRMGHTATYDPMVRCIYVFGGSKNTRWFHDVHVLDIDEWKWQLVKVNGKAPTRAYHSATLYRHELWIFGGVYPRPDPQPDGCSNDIHIFSPVMESWYSPIVKGEKPIPRSGHSATLLNDQLVVFGGWDAPISYSDLHILDMSIVEWSQPDFTGKPPSPRSWHASCALTGNRLLIHGGYNGDIALDDTHIFNLDNMAWCQIEVESKPTARVGHRALCMPYRHDNEEEDEIIIFGGGDNDGEYFDDLMSIYVPFDPVPLSSA